MSINGIIFGGDGFAQITGKFEPITLTAKGDEMEKDEMESMLRELIKYEENNDYFFLTLRERREFQAYVERLMEIGELPPHGRLIDADELKEWIRGWLKMNKYYHPHSKSNNIPIQDVYDIIGRLPTIIEGEVKE